MTVEHREFRQHGNVPTRVKCANCNYSEGVQGDWLRWRCPKCRGVISRV